MLTWPRFRVLALVMILLSIAIPAAPILARTLAQQRTLAREIARDTITEVVTTDTSILFLAQVTPTRHSIHALNTTTQRHVVIARTPTLKRGLASDGRQVVWIEGSPEAGESLQGYDLETATPFTIIPARLAQTFDSVGVTGGRLVYSETTPAHSGIYLRDIQSGSEGRLSPTGTRIVVKDASVLWSQTQTFGVYQLSESSLFFLSLDQPQAPRVLARDSGTLSGYDIAGDTVVWSFGPPAADARAYLYRLSTGQRQPISAGDALEPSIRDGTVLWTYPDRGPVEQGTMWSIQSYDIASATVSTIVEATRSFVTSRVVPNTRSLLIAQTLNAGDQTQALFLSDTAARGLRLAPATAALPQGSAQIAACGLPLNCGQVAVDSANTKVFKDANGRFKMKGVQFFLPRYGINGDTFVDHEYTTNLTAVDYWLGLAQTYVLANTIRIFVDWPSSGGSVRTSPSTLYDFATRANAKGMRVGLVIHNSSDWNITTARSDWLKNVIRYFRDRSALPLIAYISADNEINNHCGGRNCFYLSNATSPSQVDQTYINNAVNFVNSIRTIVKNENGNILVTVGTSTETTAPAGAVVADEFFKVATNINKTLATVADFISPHNYGGGVYGIGNNIRARGYARAIALEEFGWPTDPSTGSAWWTEGNAACRNDPGFPTTSPNFNLCKNTAPYFVEVNARGIRDLEASVIFAGDVSWMLADVDGKNCTRSDLYTGLYSSGTGYSPCKGTISLPPPKDKSTAFRVRTHHFYW